MKKPFLFLLIILPVAIYLFFKFFGTNTYQVPIYYFDGVQSKICSLGTDNLYRVSLPDSALKESFENKMFLFYVHTELNQNLEKMLREIERNILVNNNGDIVVIGLYNAAISNEKGGINYIFLSNEGLHDYVNCTLLVSQESDNVFNFIVLVDANMRIRGYYDGQKFDEFDRLAAELDIIRLEDK